MTYISDHSVFLSKDIESQFYHVKTPPDSSGTSRKKKMQHTLANLANLELPKFKSSPNHGLH